jgi:hypothetical protein
MFRKLKLFFKVLHGFLDKNDQYYTYKSKGSIKLLKKCLFKKWFRHFRKFGSI